MSAHDHDGDPTIDHGAGGEIVFGVCRECHTCSNVAFDGHHCEVCHAREATEVAWGDVAACLEARVLRLAIAQAPMSVGIGQLFLGHLQTCDRHAHMHMCGGCWAQHSHERPWRDGAGVLV